MSGILFHAWHIFSWARTPGATRRDALVVPPRERREARAHLRRRAEEEDPPQPAQLVGELDARQVDREIHLERRIRRAVDVLGLVTRAPVLGQRKRPGVIDVEHWRLVLHNAMEGLFEEDMASSFTMLWNI